MGVYGDQVLPRIVDVVCGNQGAAVLRERACAPLQGRVVEIGFGSGHNAGFYPPAVTEVDAIEPSEVGWKLAATRVAAARSPDPSLGERRSAPALPRRRVRLRPVDLDPLHRPRSGCCADRAAPGAQTRGAAVLRRARARRRPWRSTLAATHRASLLTGRRRLPPHSRGRRAAGGGRLRDRRGGAARPGEVWGPGARHRRFRALALAAEGPTHVPTQLRRIR